VCRIIVEHGLLVTAGIRVYDAQTDAFVPIAVHGPVSGPIGGQTIAMSDPDSRLVQAVRERRSYVCNDMLAVEAHLPVRADAERLGIRANAVFPLTVEGQVAGALSVFAAEVGFFDPELTALLEEMARNLSFAFGKLQSEAAHLASEAALRESEVRYRNLFDTSPVCIFVRQDDRVVLINPAGLRLFGASAPEQIVGRPVAELVHPEYREQAQQRVARVLAGQQADPPAEFKNLRLDGSVIETESVALPFEFQGRAAVQVMVSDISARKQAERAMLRLNAQLEERVQERTVQLQRANQELSEFSYIVSHDLKAPLRGVASLVGWLEQDHADQLGDEGRELLRLLSTRSRRMHRLIEDILHFSRLGRVRESAGSVDLDRLVREVIDSLALPAHIEARIDGTLPRVAAEETRMKQVFQNLIANAVKFMDKPRGLITIGVEPREGMWRFCVADNGPGIEARHQERIFEIFQTLSPRDDPDSTGIGLTVVKKIVELQGGRIWVESQPGQGARFMFTLPQHAAAGEAPGVAAGRKTTGGELGL
jgi:PAS domain S-box-containing protein